MWYLIVPPFIVIFGLGALLWYLSRRMEDPGTLEKMEALKDTIDSGAHSRSLDRKAFFLKLLEKNASRFKTGTLRIHNFFQQSLEGLRVKRKQLDEMRKAVADRRRADAGPLTEHEERRKAEEDRRRAHSASAKKPRLLGRWGKKGEEHVVEKPIVAEESKHSSPPPIIQKPGRSFKTFLRRREFGEPHESALAAPESEAEKSFQPTVSRTVANPDIALPGSARKNEREASLIARIADNPRDAAAYEELGDHYFAANSMEDAKACYRQALKLHPTNRAVKIKIRRLEKFFEGGAL